MITPAREETIILTSGYPQLMVEIGQRMLADLPAHLAKAAVLILPAAQMPFPWLFGWHTVHTPLIVADPDEKNLAWQRERLGERAMYILACVDNLPTEIRNLGLVLNPFGLQHDWANAPHYAPRIRERCQSEGALITL